METEQDDMLAIDTFRPLDPNLPLLASQAAIELDVLLRNKKTDLSATKRLGQLLENSLEHAVTATSPSSLIDPTTVTLINRALLESQWSKPQTTRQLVEQAWSLAKDLHQTEKDADHKSLKKVQAFCVALSECAASYLESVHSWRPSHEYRR